MSKRQFVGLQKAFYVCTAALLLGVLFAQAMTSIPRLSITFDEDLHISTGYSVLRTGDLRLVEDHPPLIGLWMSWPLLLSPDVPDPWEVPAWEQGDRRLFVRNEAWWSLPIDSWVIPPRISVSWLALLLGAFLFRWACEWFGPRAGLLALAFFVFDPNILTHGTLATLDLGVTCLIFITMYGVQRFLKHPSRKNLLISGTFLGLALSAKVSALILLPVSVGLMVLWGVRHRRKRLIVWLFVYLGVGFLTLWAVHLFKFGTPTGLSFSVPAPSYWRSVLRVGRHSATGNLAYLLGDTYLGGRWYYFPVAFVLKTPLPTLLLTGMALGMALVTIWQTFVSLSFDKLRTNKLRTDKLRTLTPSQTRPEQRWREFVLASLPVSYFLVSMTNEINLGYRHLLPIVPFLYLFIARLAGSGLPIGRSDRRKIPFRWSIILAILLLWQMIGTLRVWPFHLTFFNQIAGGPRNGYRYLADSNVDWGQGLKALRDYLEDQPWSDVRLSSYVFFILPEMYGIQATPLPPLAGVPPIFPTRFNPTPGTYVISASTLRGLKLIEVEMYNWFAQREPDDIIANAMLVYHVSERKPRPTWLAQCSVPVSPLSPKDIAEGFGRDDLRMLTFDCTQSWLYPNAGKSAGWYILHREIAVKEDSFILKRLNQARLSFEQKTPYEVPSLTIFEWNALAPMPSWQEDPLRAAPVEWPPAQVMSEGVPVSSPVPLDGPLAFLGYEVIREGRAITLVAYWRVEEQADRPFSLLAHLVDTEGHPVAVGDGLGVPWEQLQEGDLLVQRHLLVVPQDLKAGSYWIQTGAYWLEPMARFPILVEGQVVGDKLVLSSVEVK